MSGAEEKSVYRVSVLDPAIEQEMRRQLEGNNTDLLDSMVNIGALSKHRSSSRQLNKVVRAFSVLELAMGARAVFGFTSSAKNPADAPSRLRDG